MNAQLINIKQIEANNGQIKGLPKNPRFIRDSRYEALLKSIQDFPEMMELRELIVFPFDGKFITIAGNMRLKAVKELKYIEVSCKILRADTPVERLKEIVIKDNISFGQNDFDILANEFEIEDIKEWGFEDSELGINKNENENENENLEIPDKFEIIIECTNEIDQKNNYEKLISEGYQCRLLTL